MCGVLIIERERSCRVVCECGFESYMLSAPCECPRCGQFWENPRFEQERSLSAATDYSLYALTEDLAT